MTNMARPDKEIHYIYPFKFLAELAGKIGIFAPIALLIYAFHENVRDAFNLAFVVFGVSSVAIIFFAFLHVLLGDYGLDSIPRTPSNVTWSERMTTGQRDRLSIAIGLLIFVGVCAWFYIDPPKQYN